QSRNLNFLKLQIASKHRSFSSVLSQLFASIQPSSVQSNHLQTSGEEDSNYEDERDEWARRERAHSSHVVFEQVKSQQRAIVDKLKRGDLDTARRFMGEL